MQSKKIVFVGHSFHVRTRSTAFLQEFLARHFELTVIHDDSWNGLPFPDLSFIDSSYLAVIFFQNLPGGDVIKNIKNENIIFFPMYDGVELSKAWWTRYKGFKIISFSDTLHRFVSRLGFHSIYLQYFPEPAEFSPGHTNHVFFWQRITKLDFKVVSKLLPPDGMHVHIHKAIDPYHEFYQPTRQEEARFNISYSEWFQSREEMLSMLRQKGIYIAPRAYEGIGMSFLEAMAMGKAVVAVNHPTMNEYITHNVNGYLYDLENPGRLKMDNIREVQKNAHQFICDGYEQWNRDKERIIEFIYQVN